MRRTHAFQRVSGRKVAQRSVHEYPQTGRDSMDIMSLATHKDQTQQHPDLFCVRAARHTLLCSSPSNPSILQRPGPSPARPSKGPELVAVGPWLVDIGICGHSRKRSGRNRSKFGRSLSKPISASNWSNYATHGRSRTILGRSQPQKINRCRVLSKICPTLFEFGPRLLEIGPMLFEYKPTPNQRATPRHIHRETRLHPSCVQKGGMQVFPNLTRKSYSRWTKTCAQREQRPEIDK